MIIKENKRENAVNYYSYFFSLLYGASETIYTKIKLAILFVAARPKKKLFDANIFYLSFLFWTFP